jgi:hypothetical protein
MTGGPVTDEFSVLLDQSNEPVRFKAFARVDPNRQARRP